MISRKFRTLAIAAALTLGVGVAWAQQSTIGGKTTRPRFSAVGIGAPPSPIAQLLVSGTGPAVYLEETDAAANEGVWLVQINSGQLRFRACNAIGSGCTDFLTVDRTGNTVDGMDLQATAVQANGVDVATAQTGSFTCTWTGFSTTENNSCSYARAGKIVALLIDGATGTSNAASFTITGLPAAATPGVNTCAQVRALNSGAAAAANVCTQPASTTLTLGLGDNLANGFTASGTKGFNTPVTIVYQAQ